MVRAHLRGFSSAAAAAATPVAADAGTRESLCSSCPFKSPALDTLSHGAGLQRLRPATVFKEGYQPLRTRAVFQRCIRPRGSRIVAGDHSLPRKMFIGKDDLAVKNG